MKKECKHKWMPTDFDLRSVIKLDEKDRPYMDCVNKIGICFIVCLKCESYKQIELEKIKERK